MGPAEFTLAIWALLLTPGPTNTLLALSGAQRGVRASLPLIPAELCGYLLVILPLSAGGPLLLTSFPVLATVIKLSAAAWVMYLAMRLWQPVLASRASYDVTARQVFCTTLLNPKALIFGLESVLIRLNRLGIPKVALL
ncbi:LysE family translocator [Sphingobium lignivorans]|uniref:Threonine/homoserine/homoserine lactone efflux protein n=1 Tax=Sphingobium lignivorans TaxID=2735886 RepID=A0ABR6NIP1_9SPHN|nr:LysE family transporter [Sphingobium lignivorans]MBB5986976.1 threonine/homoserine/homoserine lactone efflux protein [Sphingobium lignivorans]